VKINEKLKREIIEEFKKNIKGDFLYDKISRTLYSTSACMFKRFPTCIVLPKDEEDIVESLRIAKKYNLPITARGGGSSLAGQALGEGLIIDFSKYMTNIKEVNVEEGYVTVEPGIIYSELNNILKRFNKQFAPDPSSGSYCTIGGMIANNSSGSHSLIYGATIDYLVELKVILSNGTIYSLNERNTNSLDVLPRRDTQVFTPEQLYSLIHSLIKANCRIIEEKTPKVKKNSSGYHLESVIRDDTINLSRLIAASEGTLGLILEAKLKVIDLPKRRGMILFNFSSVELMGEAVMRLLELNPSSIELVDKYALNFIHEGRSDLREFIPHNIETQLYAEFEADVIDELKERLRHSYEEIQNKRQLSFSSITALDETIQQKLWQIRKSALPLLYRRKGEKRVTSFIEDTIVPTEKIPEFLKGIYEIYKKYNVESAILGHASEGNFHTRPFLNLKDSSDIQKMQNITSEVFDFVVSLGGSISGEHGDGIIRTEYLKKYYGDLYNVYCDVKRIFDPINMFNPGIKVEPQINPIENLRYGVKYQWIASDKIELFQEKGFCYEIEKCHGCGTCRELDNQTSMCPMFKITKNESASPRAKANLLRAVLSGDLDSDILYSKEFKIFSELCIGCDMCAIECPSAIDIPWLMFRAKAYYAQMKGIGWYNSFFIDYLKAVKYLSSISTPIKFFNNLRPGRFLFEQIFGVDKRRRLPPFSKSTFQKWFKKRKSKGEKQVVYFSDVFTNYNDSDLGQAVVEVLEKNNYYVIYPAQKGCGMPMLAYGDEKGFKQIKEFNVTSLYPYAQNGIPIVVSEPTAALCLREFYKKVGDDEKTRIVSEKVFDIMEFLRLLNERDELNQDFKEVKIKLGYHIPCHLKALNIGQPSVDLLRLIPGVMIEVINEGCCGIAGTYGFKKGEKGFNQSMKIGERLFKRLSEPSIDFGLTECSACKIQLEQGTNKTTLHPIKILRNTYRKDK